MINEPMIMEWTTKIKGDDPKRFKIEDVLAGRYKPTWRDRIKKFLLGKKDA